MAGDGDAAGEAGDRPSARGAQEPGSRRPVEPSSRATILIRTATVLGEQGYAATTMREIAAAVGMRPASLYYHFASKDEIIDEVMRLTVSVLTASFEEAMERLPATASARDRIESGMRGYLGVILSEDVALSTYMRIFPQLPPILKKRVAPERRGYARLWMELFRAGERDGSILPGLDPYLSTTFVLGALNRVIEWYKPGRMDPAMITEFMVERLLRGLTTDGGPLPAGA